MAIGDPITDEPQRVRLRGSTRRRAPAAHHGARRLEQPEEQQDERNHRKRKCKPCQALAVAERRVIHAVQEATKHKGRKRREPAQVSPLTSVASSHPKCRTATPRGSTSHASVEIARASTSPATRRRVRAKGSVEARASIAPASTAPAAPAPQREGDHEGGNRVANSVPLVANAPGANEPACMRRRRNASNEAAATTASRGQKASARTPGASPSGGAPIHRETSMQAPARTGRSFWCSVEQDPEKKSGERRASRLRGLRGRARLRRLHAVHPPVCVRWRPRCLESRWSASPARAFCSS